MKTDWALRLASAGDIPAIEQLIPLSVRSLQAGDYSSAQIEAAFGQVYGVDRFLISDGTYFVAEAEGAVVACGGWSRRQAMFGGDRERSGQNELLDPTVDPARIRAFYVHPEWTRRGIARAILHACEKAIVEDKFHHVELAATLTGVPLYLATGYSTIERYEVPMRDGLTLPVVKMGKRFG